MTLNCSTATGAADVQAAQVFAQQAAGAGVTVKVNKVDASAYWNTGNYGTYPFAMTYWSTRNYLAQAQLCLLPAQNGDDAALYWTETYWNDAEWLKLFNEAVVDRRRHQAQRDGLAARDDRLRAWRLPHLRARRAERRVQRQAWRRRAGRLRR